MNSRRGVAPTGHAIARMLDAVVVRDGSRRVIFSGIREVHQDKGEFRCEHVAVIVGNLRKSSPRKDGACVGRARARVAGMGVRPGAWPAASTKQDDDATEESRVVRVCGVRTPEYNIGSRVPERASISARAREGRSVCGTGRLRGGQRVAWRGWRNRRFTSLDYVRDGTVNMPAMPQPEAYFGRPSCSMPTASTIDSTGKFLEKIMQAFCGVDRAQC